MVTILVHSAKIAGAWCAMARVPCGQQVEETMICDNAKSQAAMERAVHRFLRSKCQPQQGLVTVQWHDLGVLYAD